MDALQIQPVKTGPRSRYSLSLGIEPTGDYAVGYTRKQSGFSECSCSSIKREHVWLEGTDVYVCSVCGELKDKAHMFITETPKPESFESVAELKVPGCHARLVRIAESDHGPMAVVDINGVELYYKCTQRMPGAPYCWLFDHSVPENFMSNESQLLDLTVPCAIHKHVPAPRVEVEWLLRAVSSKH